MAPGGSSGGYRAARRDFSVRSGLLPSSALFTPEQLTEIYRCIHETLENTDPIPDDRRKLLESAAGQIEDFVPDLDERSASPAKKSRSLHVNKTLRTARLRAGWNSADARNYKAVSRGGRQLPSGSAGRELR